MNNQSLKVLGWVSEIDWIFWIPSLLATIIMIVGFVIIVGWMFQNEFQFLLAVGQSHRQAVETLIKISIPVAILIIVFGYLIWRQEIRPLYALLRNKKSTR